MSEYSIEQAGPGDVAAVLCDAFRDYPVMRFVAGDRDSYDLRLAQLIGLFVAGRSLRGHPMLGLRNPQGHVAAAITLTPPGQHTTPAGLVALGESCWRSLGADAMRRYEAMNRAWSALPAPEMFWHVNMLGVRRADRGQGHGDILLQAACERAMADPACRGVDLTTEDAANLAFYRDRGFVVAGHATVGDGPETWMLVREFR